MSVNFFGLTGPQGVLPYHYSLLIIERLRSRDSALAAFLDIFHHRILSLFYRAWEKNQPTVTSEKQRDDRIGEHLLDLIGESVNPSAPGPTPLQRMLLFYPGLLGAQPRSAIGLEQLIEDVFDVPVTIEQFVGGWYPLAAREQCALGEEEEDVSAQLGLGVVVGDEVWDQQTRVRIRIGPLDTHKYAEFLPTGSAHELLRRLVRFYSRDAFDFEVQLVLERDAVAGCVLGDDTVAPLGWATWIRTGEFSRDPDDTVLQL
jgi:type VI secretion system protein ImpH